MRRWTAASLLVVAALYGWLAHQWSVALPIAAVLVLAMVTRARLTLGTAARRVVIGLAAAAGIAVGWLTGANTGIDVLHKPWTSLALAGLFAGVAQVVTMGGSAGRSPGGSLRDVATPSEAPREHARSPFAFLPGLVAMMAAGETLAGPVYGVAVIAWLALAIAALRAGDGGRPALGDVPRRARLAAGGILAASAVLAAGATLGLPPASRWVERRILRAIGGAETGFSDRMWLGSLDGLLDSDEVVMRLEGPRTDYLRGAVFDHYEIGRWGHLRPARPRPFDASAPAEGGDRVRLSVVSGARDRYFLPADARAVAARGALVVDRFGILRLDGGTAAEVSFAIGGPPQLVPDEPTDDDLDIPLALRRPLGRIAHDWTAGATTPEAKLAAIVAHLHDGFTYSRTFKRRRSDPILDFLIDDHRGHCEYFATATALLARAAGIPARVVAGYRVAEENLLGRYWVVREKNAHAWAEVHLPGKGFVTVDTTPEDPLAQNAIHPSSWAGALADLLSAWWSRAVARITLLHLIGAGVALIAVSLVVRQLRRLPRGARARQARVRADPPPPSLLRLLDALGRRGIARAETEPIERFAARLAEAGLAEAAALLRRWAAFRYGGIGDGEALQREMDGCAEQLKRTG